MFPDDAPPPSLGIVPRSQKFRAFCAITPIHILLPAGIPIQN